MCVKSCVCVFHRDFTGTVDLSLVSRYSQICSMYVQWILAVCVSRTQL